MIKLSEFINFLDEVTMQRDIADYKTAYNGLQCENDSKTVSKIACAVDAGLYEIQEAIKMNADILLVHHGMFWEAPLPITKLNYKKIASMIKSNLALYSCHLPVDANMDFGNNISIARALGLEVIENCFDFVGTKIGVLCKANCSRKELSLKLQKLFPNTYKALEFGSESPERIAICSGGAGDCIDLLESINCDTYITGEIKEEYFIKTRDNNYNVYPCGHYATEVFGIHNLAKIAAEKFALECEFISTNNII